MDHVAIFYAGVAAAIGRYQKNPFDFLYERDLQGLLFCSLLNAFDGCVLEMKGGYHDDVAVYGGTDTIRTVPIKCEYPNVEVFDIALIDSRNLRSFDPNVSRAERWRNDAFWNQPVRVAAEVKYLQLGDRPAHKLAGVENDAKKLRRYYDWRHQQGHPFLGIAMLFVQSPSQALTPLRVGPQKEWDEDIEDGIAKYLVGPREWIRVGF